MCRMRIRAARTAESCRGGSGVARSSRARRSVTGGRVSVGRRSWSTGSAGNSSAAGGTVAAGDWDVAAGAGAAFRSTAAAFVSSGWHASVRAPVSARGRRRLLTNGGRCAVVPGFSGVHLALRPRAGLLRTVALQMPFRQPAEQPEANHPFAGRTRSPAAVGPPAE